MSTESLKHKKAEELVEGDRIFFTDEDLGIHQTLSTIEVVDTADGIVYLDLDNGQEVPAN